MAAHKLLDFLADSEEFLRIIKKIKDGYRKLSVRIPEGSQRAFFLAGLWRSLPEKSIVVLTAGARDGEKLFGDLQAFLDEDRVFFFSQPDLYPYEEADPSLNVAQERAEVLKCLADKESAMVVAPLQAVLFNTAPYDKFFNAVMHIKTADVFDARDFVEKLVGAGYERVALVDKKGQLAVRGGIVDVFPLTEEQPVRIELFGDEVDSIRYFDILTQKSVEEIDSVTISPASELLLDNNDFGRAAEAVERDVNDLLAALKNKGDRDREKLARNKYKAIIEKLQTGTRFPGIGQFAPYFYEQAGNLFDYLQNDSIVVMLEPDNLNSHFEASEREINDVYLEMLEQGQVLASQNKAYFSFADLSVSLSKKLQLNLTALVEQNQGIPQFELASQTIDSFQEDIAKLLNKLMVWQEDKLKQVFMLSSTGRARRLKEIFEEANTDITYTPDGENTLSHDREIMIGSLSGGFVFPEAGIVIITDAEVFGNVRRRRKKKAKLDSPTIRLDDLTVGDYVVHTSYGVCAYRGIGVTEFGGVKKEYLHFEFAANDKLYVPVEQIGLIQPYFGFESDRPKLSKLGGSEWNKTRKKVKSAVKEIAGELLKLYAQREIEGGNAFSKDTPWQQEFEESFPYEETPDQLKAIQDAKKDMESRMPMDRLVCGDVGYGKTEVAVRAAFKAVMDGKQVAVLVPTTILAQQHYNTFSDRFAGYPITINVLSRFRTAAEQKNTVKALANGKVDIIIGTHRLVQKDIKFKDLGLLIVDEEQRFGVSHKEKLKQLRKNVDVLTLTATPIPRTLHMALAGVRDMSVIETPPEERFPIRTHVIERNDNIIREAILRELNREGQVYYVHNRIETIDRVAENIKKLVPKASIAVAHGQMDEVFLERIMFDFAAGKYDILVCTTIIETGLDIPNVNTIIIDHADKMGLSQLYQLRGRVGRTNRIAYAYLATQPDRIRSEVAEKRLDAIKEFTQLGSGFKIALRDLEIRGAGNLLGAEQHGHIAAVGFDLYCSMLEDAVKELKGEKKVTTRDIVIELPIEAFIPDIYMADTRQKITLYRRLASTLKLDELSDLRKETYDRYGDIPDQLERLFKITELKIYAGQVGIINFASEGGKVILRFTPEEEMLAEKAAKLFEAFPRQIAFVPGETPALAVKTESLDQDKTLFLLKRILKTIAE